MKCTRFAPLLFTALAALASQAQGFIARELSTGGLAYAISRGAVGGSLGSHAVLWKGKSVIDVHPADFTFSAISGRSGDVSVGYAGVSALAQSPIVWHGTTASALSVPFAYVTARAVATDGQQIVGYAAETDVENGVGPSHAMLWDVSSGAAIDLGDGYTVNGVGAGVQVGTRVGSSGTTAGLWRGTPASFVDLHVHGFDTSVACDTNGTIQIGYIGLDVRVRNEARPRDIRFYSAGYWSGTAESFNYLASDYRHSFAIAIKGNTIVGYGNTSDAIGTPRDSHAIAWVGEAHDPVDLHALLPADMKTSRATSVDEVGNIVGYGVTTTGVIRSYTWLRRANEPRQFVAVP